jgi:hypothetical protein
MNLKHFAVLQKLQGKSNLLEYLVENKDVPIVELEKAFGSLLEKETSTVAEEVVSDYKTYLQKNTQLGVVTVSDNEFTVTGGVDNRLVEAIQLLTGDTKEDIVDNLVATVMSEIRGSKELTVSNVEISDEDIVTTVKYVIDDAEYAISHADLAEEIPVEKPVGEVEQSVAEISFDDILRQDEPTIPEHVEIDLDEIGEDVQAPVEEHEPVLADMLDAEAQEHNAVSGDEAFEHYQDAVQRVYEFVVKELQNRNLDKRLNLHI